MRKILIVEDSRALLMGLEDALCQAGFAVASAAGIREAKDKLDTRVDLVLLDLNLPDGKGFSFCEYIKTVRDVPVIFLTVRDDERDIVKGLDIGADDYMTKPFKLSVLISRINAVLLERLWDADGEFVNDNTLTSLIKRLREKVESTLKTGLAVAHGFW